MAHLVLVVFQQPLHAVGHILYVERPLVSISQHALCAAVARDDDKALVIFGIEHVVGSLFGILGAKSWCTVWSTVANRLAPFAHKLAGQLTCLLLTDRLCRSSACQK